MAGNLNKGPCHRLVTLPAKESEAVFTKAMRGRRFDNPGTANDWVTLLRINTVDPNDIPEW